MKKIVITLSLVLCFHCLYGCSSIDLGESKTSMIESSNMQRDNNYLDHYTINSENSTKNSKEENKEKLESTDLSFQTPPDFCSYSFNSTTELYNVINKHDSFINDASNDYGDLFYKTLSAFENNKITLSVPMINGDMFPLRNKENYSNITLITSELYTLPWIWYHCSNNDNDIDIKIAYPSVLESNEVNSAKTYYDVLKIIAPNAPNPDNYSEFESYQNIYEAEINLADNKNVVAMISEIKDSSKVYVMFIYDGILVSIYTDNDNLSKDFWDSFSLENY